MFVFKGSDAFSGAARQRHVDVVARLGRAARRPMATSQPAGPPASHGAAADASHTTSTLRFASRLKSVTTAPRKNLDPKDMEILRLRRENAKLRAALVDDGMRL